MLLAVLATATTALAAPTADAAGPVGLDVRALPIELGPDGGAPVELSVTVAEGGVVPEELELELELESSVSSRLALQQALATPSVRLPVRGRMRAPLVASTAQQAVEIDLPALGVVAADATAGVYPLVLRLLVAGEPSDEVRTAVVVTGAERGPPVRAALVLPLDGPFEVPRDDVYARDPLAGDLGPEGRLPALAAELAAAEDLPLTLAVSPTVLEQAALASQGYTTRDEAGLVEVLPDDGPARRAADLLSDVRSVVARPDVEQVALARADADLVALVRGGYADEARRALAGGVVLEELTGTRPVQGYLWPPDAIDPATLAVAEETGTQTLLLGADAVAVDRGDELSPSPTHRLVVPSGAQVTAVVADPWAAPLLARGDAGVDGPALAAQRVLVETAALYAERPYAAQPRGILLLPPQRFDPDPPFLRALLRGLAHAGWLEPVTVPGLVTEVAAAPDAELAYPPSAAAAELGASYLGRLARARDTVGPLARLVPGDGGLATASDRLLRLAASVDFRDDRAAGLALVERTAAQATDVFRAVTVSRGPLITLTSRSGSVPVTLRSTGATELDVAVTVSSNDFTFPDGTTQDLTLEPAQEATPSERVVTFRAEARTPGGTRPLTVRVTDTSGARVLAEGSVVVRSTGFSPVAVLLTAGAALVLGIWWTRDARRRRHAAPPSRSPPSRETVA